MPVTITNVPRDYAWGSTTLLAELTGRAATGDPEAEVWFGDHASDPADLADGRSLADLTGGSLPFLLKLLAAGSPLSVQVHPTKAQAEAGFAAQGGVPGANYADANHKPELIVALSETFEALCGLSPVDESIEGLRLVPQNAGVLEVIRRLESDALGDVIAWALSPDAHDAVADVCLALSQAEIAAPEGAFGKQGTAARVRMLQRVAEQYPGDGGVVVAGLMNYVVLARDEALFLGAGIVHAYLAGLGVEIMAASDNVLRGGLTPKRVDVPELLRIVRAEPTPVEILPPGGEYPAPVPDFTLERVQLDAGEPFALPGGGAPTIVLSTRGEATVASSTGQADAAVGEAVYLDASETARVVTSAHGGTIFIASTKLI